MKVGGSEEVVFIFDVVEALIIFEAKDRRFLPLILAMQVNTSIRPRERGARRSKFVKDSKHPAKPSPRSLT